MSWGSRGRSDADALAVYVIFAYGATDLSPDEAARRAVAALDNTQYMGRTLRADAVAGGVGDPKCTVFVGSPSFSGKPRGAGMVDDRRPFGREYSRATIHHLVYRL